MKRREFLQNAAKAGLGVVVGSALFDMANVKTIKATSRFVTPEVREIPINLIDAPELAEVGGTYHLEVEDLERDLLVAHVAKDQFVAVDIKCTHKGCDVNYRHKEKDFFCPCHSSVFALSGAVVKGPAKKPLTYYGAVLKGDEVMVTVYGADEKPPTNCIPNEDSLKRFVPIDSVKVDTTKSEF